MPQKRNPDMAELIRGRTAKTIANWTTMAGVMKALPLGYNRDTQEDKPPLFDSLRKVEDSIELVRLMLDTANWQLDHMASSVRGDFSTATDLADFLASTGIPFRVAHEMVGQVVRACQASGIGLEELTVESLARINPDIPADALSCLSPEGSIARRNSAGAPGPVAMQAQLQLAQSALEATGFPYSSVSTERRRDL
jgi:argininosuccinate lyase